MLKTFLEVLFVGGGWGDCLWSFSVFFPMLPLGDRPSLSLSWSVAASCLFSRPRSPTPHPCSSSPHSAARLEAVGPTVCLSCHFSAGNSSPASAAFFQALLSDEMGHFQGGMVVDQVLLPVLLCPKSYPQVNLVPPIQPPLTSRSPCSAVL